MTDEPFSIDSRVLFSEKRSEIQNAPIIVADSLKTPENLGNIIRLAANIGIRKIICVDTIQHRESKVRKTACMAWDYVELIYATKENLCDHIPQGYELVALETSTISKNIYTTELPRKMALVVGNEQDGICKELLDKCPLHVHIPMTGPATSMNVSHATGVALFEWVRRITIQQNS